MVSIGTNIGVHAFWGFSVAAAVFDGRTETK